MHSRSYRNIFIQRISNNQNALENSPERTQKKNYRIRQLDYENSCSEQIIRKIGITDIGEMHPKERHL